MVAIGSPAGRSETDGPPFIYSTRIRHVRTEPVRRTYEHTSYSWFVDLDDLPRLPRPLAPFARFHGADHLDGASGDGLRTRVDAFLDRHGVDLRGGRVTALMNARVLGYVFNPLTVYWCHDPEDRLECVIAEVHNTYGQRHSYLLRPDRRGHAEADKQFYVSPFNDTSGRYRMALPEPGEHLSLNVTLHRQGHDPFVAVVTGDRHPADTANVLRAQAHAPWAPLAVSAYIRIEGVRLWAKGLPIQPRPDHPDHAGTDARSESGGGREDGPSPRAADGPGSVVPAVPRTLRARLAAPVVGALFRRAARALDAQGTPIRIEFPDGTVIGDNRRPDPAADPAPRMILRDPDALARRVGADGLIGLGESYMAGDWTSPDLAAVLTALASRMERLVPRPMQSMRRIYVRRRPAREQNSTANARTNVSHHYDLSDDLFAAFLDETMTYSSALFDDPATARERSDGSGTADGDGAADPQREMPALRRTHGLMEHGAGDDGTPAPRNGGRRDAGGPGHAPEVSAPHDDLAAAQRNKIDRLLDRAGVTEGTRLLEVGTGWGELCIRAADRGARVRSATLSRAQQEEAQRRVAAAGHSGSVRIDLLDYREVTGEYDAVVSVEMIEAVGHEYWPSYFTALDRLLAPGGKVALQAITMPHDRMLRTRDTYTWIQKYIFPGGFLPSTEAIAETARQHTSLRIAERLTFGAHYARTLRLWDERCQEQSRRLDELGFDRLFRRMWHFYLCYSEAGFRSGYLDVQQILFERPGERP